MLASFYETKLHKALLVEIKKMFKCRCCFIVVKALSCTLLLLFTDICMPLQETNISTKQKTLKNLNWRNADQFSIYKHERGVELGCTNKQLQLNGQSGT